MMEVHRSSRKVQLRLLNFNSAWIFSTSFRKIFNIKFHENDDYKSRFSKFSERT
jgi:hypothetical protein